MKQQLQQIRGKLGPIADGDWDNEMYVIDRAKQALTALAELEAMVGAQEPCGWFESPYGAFRANPLLNVTFPASTLTWQIPAFIATPPAQQPQAETEMRPADKHDMAVYRAIAEGYHADKQPQAGQYQGDDSIAIPRSLIAAACGAIRLKHDAPKLLAELRRYTVGDWSRALTQQPQAEAVRWCPDVCPITGKPFFMWIEHPQHGDVPTYGGPYDSYTIPVRHEDGSFCCERYDHDNGGWVTDEVHDVGVQIVSDQAYVSDEAPQQAEAVPPGYVLVPVEPTEAMHRAAVKTIQRCTGNADFPPAVWRAMLASAQGEKP